MSPASNTHIFLFQINNGTGQNGSYLQSIKTVALSDPDQVIVCEAGETIMNPGHHISSSSGTQTFEPQAQGLGEK